MNLSEVTRSTAPPLPRPGDEQKVVVSKVNAAILTLFNRDGDKEARIRSLENKTSRTVGKRATVKYFGNMWRITAEEEAPFRLLAEFSDDDWVTVAQTQLAP